MEAVHPTQVQRLSLGHYRKLKSQSQSQLQTHTHTHTHTECWLISGRTFLYRCTVTFPRPQTFKDQSSNSFTHKHQSVVCLLTLVHSECKGAAGDRTLSSLCAAEHRSGTSRWSSCLFSCRETKKKEDSGFYFKTSQAAWDFDRSGLGHWPSQ